MEEDEVKVEEKKDEIAIIAMELPNGVQIIGQVVKETETELALKDAGKIVTVPSKTSDGAVNVGFLPMSFFTAQDIIVMSRYHVIFYFTPENKLVDAYLNFVQDYKARRAGIHLPSSGSISNLKI